MPGDRRIPGSAESYPEDRDLLHALLEEPPGLEGWPGAGLAEPGLTPGQRALAATWRLDVEVRNGGFGQYFGALGSGAPGAARAALEGLDRFGAAEHRRLLEAAMALFERGLPTEPPPQADAEPGVPRTEERYDATVRHAVIGMMDPDLETLRQRRRSRDRRAAALRAVYGALDDAYRTLASEGSPLERFWVAYARAHPGEFFTR